MKAVGLLPLTRRSHTLDLVPGSTISRRFWDGRSPDLVQPSFARKTEYQHLDDLSPDRRGNRAAGFFSPSGRRRILAALGLNGRRSLYLADPAPVHPQAPYFDELSAPTSANQYLLESRPTAKESKGYVERLRVCITELPSVEFWPSPKLSVLPAVSDREIGLLKRKGPLGFDCPAALFVLG